MPWASLDDSFYDHPKIVAIGNEAAGVLARSIAYCARHLTDGVIAREVVLNIAGTRRSTVVRTLIEAGFYTEHGTRGETLVIRDFLDYNRSRAEVEEDRWNVNNRKRSQRGQALEPRPDFESMSPLLSLGLSPVTSRRTSRVTSRATDAGPHARARPAATSTPPQRGRGDQNRSRTPGPLAPEAPVPGYDNLHPALRAAIPRDRLEKKLADPDCRVDDQGRIHLGPYLYEPHLYPQEPA